MSMRQFVLVLVVASTVALEGCSRMHASKSSALAPNTTILILPPRNLVQNGVPHPAAADSGKYFQKALQRELNRRSGRSSIRAESLPPDTDATYEKEVTPDIAISKGLAQSADYCLVLVQGEFLNAAPMTFRPDFVSLVSGALLEVQTRKEVWSLDRAYRIEDANFGDHYGLIDQVAAKVAESVLK